MDPLFGRLLTLVVLEIVLGIDNLVFIAILADKLPPKQRDKARIIGLSLALLMRLGLLSVISWMVTLTTPLFSVGDFSFSGRDLILLFGGVFLLFKATMELHERLEGQTHQDGANRGYAKFWAVVVQIVILDAVFSLDAVITAVGMVNDLPVMMAAVVIAMAVMLLASKPLTNFVNAHPTIVVLCLSFLLMIGLSLIAEGFGLHIPKGYLYAAIGFSILIELFNQIARRNFIKHQARRPMRERTAEAIMRLMGQQRTPQTDDAVALPRDETFAAEERYMISGVLTLASRSLRSVMTPRTDISWVDCDAPARRYAHSCWIRRTACSRCVVIRWMRSSAWYAPRICWWRWSKVKTSPSSPPARRRSWCRKPWTSSSCWRCCVAPKGVWWWSPMSSASCRGW